MDFPVSFGLNPVWRRLRRRQGGRQILLDSPRSGNGAFPAHLKPSTPWIGITPRMAPAADP